uniref:Ig-like domain-containing protein n=1 Tax=Rattus norvegicus TaxID=10116 RepID=A0A8I5ZL18_RAT
TCDKLLICSSGCFAGCNVAQKVTQVQSTASRQEGEDVTLECSYKTSYGAYYLFWYKQLLSGEMVFLFRQFSFDSQNQRSGRYSVVFQKSLKSISLVISASRPEDSGKYFCAVSDLTQCFK